MTEKIKDLTILGSTGSIGRQSLEVAEALCIPVSGISCNCNHLLAEKQIRKFKPSFCAVADIETASLLRAATKDLSVKILVGTDGIIQMIKELSSDVCINAIAGNAGLAPAYAAVSSCRRFAIANKEILVSAGSLIIEKAKKHACEILPVDSEHSAIFQCLRAGRHSDVARLILTCSGGAFRDYTKEMLVNARAENALEHPNWNMGKKITVDCATLMNKGLELIEASVLFDIPPSAVDVVIHKESIIHSMVEYIDNAVIAQLGSPDMRTCIQYALTYPERETGLAKKLDFAQIGSLHFALPDRKRFPCLALAEKAARLGGALPCVLNSANEAAVSLYLENKIKYFDISDIIENEMSKNNNVALNSVEDVIEFSTQIKESVLSSHKKGSV